MPEWTDIGFEVPPLGRGGGHEAGLSLFEAER